MASTDHPSQPPLKLDKGEGPPAPPFDWQPWAVRIAIAVVIVSFAAAAWWEMKERSENIRQYSARQIEISQDVKWIRQHMEKTK